MEKYDEKLGEIKNLLKPTKEEKERFHSIFDEIKKSLEKIGKVDLMGSVAKDTFIKGHREMDVFVFIERSKQVKEALSEIKNALKDKKIEIAYAHHPYLRTYINNIRVDIVPAYYIEEGEKPITAVDRTRLHKDYVLKNIKEEQKDEIRLLKQFLKNINTYGAEIKTEGFSGYFCECLIIKEGNFINALKFFSELKYQLRDNKLFFPDPIDENRNIMASLSERNFLKTFIASRAFFKTKNVEDFFFFDHSKFKVYEKALSIKFEKPDVVEDIRFGVLKRIARACVNKLNEHGINVKDYYVYEEKEYEKAYDCISFTFFDERPIKHKLIRSPPIYMKEYLKSFVEKHEKNGSLKFSKDGLVVVKEMPYKSVTAIIRNFLSSYKMKFYKNNACKIIKMLTPYLERELALEKFLLGGLNDNVKSG